MPLPLLHAVESLRTLDNLLRNWVKDICGICFNRVLVIDACCFGQIVDLRIAVLVSCPDPVRS